MIAKILSSSGSFDGVYYNTDKIDKGKGELMAVRNFGALQGLAGLRPEDYKNYLKMVSATNKQVSKPQFHVVISAKGRSHDKYQLMGIAELWLEKMGYGEQPYLIIFHKDTANNHVHIVTTRIDKQGKKINSAFEKNRAIQQLNIVMGMDEKYSAQKDIEKALTYSFSTKAQFMMILESQGYKMAAKGDKFSVVKFGKVQGEISLATVEKRMALAAPDAARMKQLAALLYKYAPQYDYLKEEHGIQLLFHSKDGKKPYGYTVIDHAAKAVYKGGDIIPLKDLPDKKDPGIQSPDTKYREPVPEKFNRDYYRAMLKAALDNFPDLKQGLRQVGLTIYLRDEQYFLIDHHRNAFMPLEKLLDKQEYGMVMQAFAASGEVAAEIEKQYLTAPIITASVDDEATHGRKRRRKKNQ